jgi:2-polyprenyl-6-methoxyphenol hydroxylase-like FAD-dependent oxidoreductase
MKSIAIIGAGIGGCTTYLFLKKYLPPDVTVHIYESHPPPPYLSDFHKLSTTESALSADAANVTSAVGGFLGLSPNGIRVIESLNRGIYERIKAVAIEVEVFGAQVSSGRMLGNFKAGGKRHGHGTLLVARAAVHDAVLKEIKSEDISFNMKAENVIDGARSVKIEFENGETEEAELVIGADGVWGRTREAIPECGGFKPEYE